MKEIQPHEEKYFKDIVLKSILDEISNEEEPKPVLDDLIPSNTRIGIKRQMTWFIFSSLSILALASFFIPTPNDVSEPTQTMIIAQQDIPLQTNGKVQKETEYIQENKEEMQKVRLLDHVSTKLMIESREDSLIIISKNASKASIKPKPQNDHEIAKAQLLEQMRN